MSYYVFFIPFSIWYCETCHGKEAECVCETLSAWLVLFWSVAHSGWYGHQICCDGVTLCTSSCVGCWYFGLQCIVLLVFCTETLQRILISLGAQGAVPSLCVCCHGQWVPAGDMARRLAQHCHPPSSSVYTPRFMNDFVVEVLIWWKNFGINLGSGCWRGNSFTTFCLPVTAA